ncbi:MAG TPA: hypothetical protein VE826_13825, partial [Dongiaceae bacterium]|nr:hypothetical protein [Dongiaceae bacterium]
MKRSVAILLCALLAACGGGGGGGSSTTPPPPPQSGLAKLTITIPSASGTSASRRRPAYISPSTRSVTISGSGVPTTTVAVGTNAPNCAPGSGGTVCTVNFPVPAGTATVTLATFASTDGSGMPLSTQSLTVTVTANAVTSIDVTLNGVVAALAISVSPDVLASGHASTSSVAVNALDASGNVIVGPGNYVNAAGSAVTVTLTDSDTSGATHLSQTSLTAPAASAISLSYNGAQIGNFTLSASASGIPIASAQVTVNSGTQTIFVGVGGYCAGAISGIGNALSYQTLPGGGIGPSVGNLLLPAVAVWMDVGAHGDLFELRQPTPGQAQYAVLRWPSSATGQTTVASATISGASTLLTSGTRLAADSSGGVWVANSSPAELLHFAPGANGNVAPDRVVTGIVGVPGTLTFDGSGVAVDSHDNVYTAAHGNGQTRVYELPANANGAAAPIASYGVDGAAGQPSIDRHTDAVWIAPASVYAGGAAVAPSPGATPIDVDGVFGFPAGSSAPSRVLYGTTSFSIATGSPVPQHTVAALAFDDRGNTYAQYQYYEGGMCPTNQAINTFGPSQNGDVTPVQNYQVGASRPIGIVIPVSTQAPSNATPPGTQNGVVVTSRTSL